MTYPITREEIEALYDKAAVEKSVTDAINAMSICDSEAVRFISRYANLNSWFGSGVASLSGKIGRSRHVFIDPSEGIADLADRSVLVASYFFDAARDEFDDRDTKHRDPHRSLAQAFLKGMIEFYCISDEDANTITATPIWMQGIRNAVSRGYGVGTPDDTGELFRSMGYHLGSEILADLEFSLIDAFFKARGNSSLRHYLSNNEFEIQDQKHNGYAWISLHSGTGSAKEVEHFEAATKGCEVALSYMADSDYADYRHQVHRGIQDFVRDHQYFFKNVQLEMTGQLPHGV